VGLTGQILTGTAKRTFFGRTALLGSALSGSWMARRINPPSV